MRSLPAAQWPTSLAPNRDPDVVARGKCRCKLVNGWRTEDGWLLEPVVHRDRWYRVVISVRPYDSLLESVHVDEWEHSSPMSVWCRHGVSAPDVAQEVRRWRPKHRVAA
jgi:hypothetical protein